MIFLRDGNTLTSNFLFRNKFAQLSGGNGSVPWIAQGSFNVLIVDVKHVLIVAFSITKRAILVHYTVQCLLLVSIWIIPRLATDEATNHNFVNSISSHKIIHVSIKLS